MKKYLALFAALLMLQSVAEAQSDLRKIGKFLEGIQQMQNQNQRGQSNPPPRTEQNGPGVRRVDPNQSGNRNQGDFQLPGIVVPGRPSGQPYQPGARITYPNQPYSNQPYSNQPYPNQRFPNQALPNQSYPNQSFPQQTYPQGQSVPQPTYGEPPTAPQKIYSQLPIKIRCAPECLGTCNYDLISSSGKAYPYTIRANQVQSLSETTDWLCRYQSVTGGTYQTYRLRGGKTYEMRRDNNRWQLYMVP